MKTSTPRTYLRRRPRAGHDGFTMIEILLVIVIIGVLAALLLPAINGAIIKAKEATVNAEINAMAQALADFKSKYGDYPPSRILLVESGNYTTAMGTATTAGITSDIAYQTLAQRSILALRKFWPRMAISTNGTAPSIPNGTGALTGWYDFNGNGTPGETYILDGRECLTFFLGGVPTYSTTATVATVPTGFAGGMGGFSRNPQNPFLNNIVGSTNYGNNRSAPLFEFNGGRLQMLPEELAAVRSQTGVPGYFDPSSTSINPSFYAYFSAYGGPYDPNDVNSADPSSSSSTEMDLNGNVITLPFVLNFPIVGGPPNVSQSPPPNPYTNSDVGTALLTATSYLNPNSFQIISPGADYHYGTGGQYTPNSPISLPNTINNSGTSTNANDRSFEQDNLSNFHNGRLQ